MLLIFGEPNPSDEHLKELSPVNHVTSKTPPTFMWHTANDGFVIVRNSINFSNEISKKKIPYELRIFENGDPLLTDNWMYNDKKHIPSILITPVLIKSNNIDAVLIKSGYFKREHVYGSGG